MAADIPDQPSANGGALKLETHDVIKEKILDKIFLPNGGEPQ
jgi:hypothetical protein